MNFTQLGKFIENLENHTPALYVTRVDVMRKENVTLKQELLGVNEVTIDISTVMPRRILPL